MGKWEMGKMGKHAHTELNRIEGGDFAAERLHHQGRHRVTDIAREFRFLSMRGEETLETVFGLRGLATANSPVDNLGGRPVSRLCRDEKGLKNGHT